MKKIRKIAIVMMGVLALVACKKTNPDAAGPEAVTKQLSPQELTEYFTGTAQEVINTFKAADQQAVIEVVDRLIYEFDYYSYNWDAFEYHYDGRYDNIFEVARYVSKVAKGEVMAVPASDFVFSLSRESVIFEADDVNRRWVFKGSASDGSSQVIYKYGQKTCIAKLWGEGREKTYEVDVPDINKHYTAYVPEKIIFTITVDGTEQARLTLKIDLDLNDHYNMAMEGRLANLNWNYDIQVATTHASFKANFLYGSASLVAFEAVLPSYVTLDKQSNESWEDWIERYGDRYDLLLKQIGSATGSLNLQNKVQVKGNVKDGGTFYSARARWEDKYDTYYNGNWWNAPHRQKGACQELADIYNDNLSLGAYFNSDIQQVQVKMDARKVTGSTYNYNLGRYEEYSYYETIPVLFFPQNSTTYEFADYFTDTRFSGVLNWTEILINNYIDLFKFIDIDRVRF